jgi:hypothetical protein
MTNDSTTSFRTDIINKHKAAPRASSLMFVRQFARVCMCIGGSDTPALILN